MALRLGFTCDEMLHADQPEAWKVLVKAWEDNEIWKAATKGVASDEELMQWVLKIFSPRWTMPDVRCAKVTEDATGKIVAWSGLQLPWKSTPAMTAELKALASSKDMPPTLEGMNVEALHELLHVMGAAAELGYDPEHDFHRKATSVLPGYQNMGLGRFLTHAWNDVTDEAGERTWCPAAPSSYKMFLSEGFVDKLVKDTKVERWGGTREGSLYHIMLREPQKVY